MPFKIVKTLERGEFQLCVVPSLWEKQGTLRWPPKYKNIDKIIRKEDSTPGHDWKTMTCETKRNCLPTYAHATKELKVMEQHSETDTDGCQVLPDPSPQRFQQLNQIDDFDAFAECLQKNTNNSRDSRPSKNTFINYTPAYTSGATATSVGLIIQANQANVPQAIPVSNVTDVSVEEANYQECTNENLNTVILSNQNIISEKLDTIMSMFQNQNKIIDNMAKKIAIMSVQLEELNNKQYARDEQLMTVTALKDARDNESFNFTIIQNELELQSLETTLSDKDEYKKLKKNLSFLCAPAVGNGISCAYKLLDTLFSRNFVCSCSWSGGSRGDVAKVPLKNYKFFQKFFLSMVRSWDNSFTKEECEKFFKTVLKNATKRKAMQNLRASAKRSRKTKTVNKKVEEKLNVSPLASEQAKEIDVSQNVSVDNSDAAATSNNYEQHRDSIAKEIDGEDDNSLL